MVGNSLPKFNAIEVHNVTGADSFAFLFEDDCV
jgi:hypothetical protein